MSITDNDCMGRTGHACARGSCRTPTVIQVTNSGYKIVKDESCMRSGIMHDDGQTRE